MPIKLENVGIAVRDLDAAIASFTDLGLTVLGRTTVEGEWTDTAVGLDGNHATIAMLRHPTTSTLPSEREEARCRASRAEVAGGGSN